MPRETCVLEKLTLRENDAAGIVSFSASAVSAVAAMAVRLGELMLAEPRLEEIEINPVLVRETGAVAVDALVRRA